jgi:type IV pilus assembly protein PilV
MNRFPSASQFQQKGAILLEALIAVVIFSFGLLALAGLQAVMIKNTDDAKYRAEASFIAQQKLGEIWTDASNNAGLAGYAETVATPQLPNGSTTVGVDPNRLVTVTVTWQLPGGDPHSYSTNARVEGIE